MRADGQSGRDQMRNRDSDDTPPLGEEARAQRRATSMPWVWMMVGLVVVIAFVAALAAGGGHFLGVAGPAAQQTMGGMPAPTKR